MIFKQRLPMDEERKKLFGTDGIRGVANSDPMTAEMALRVGKGIASIVKTENRHNRILIGSPHRLQQTHQPYYQTNYSVTKHAHPSFPMKF